jgi:hypothetical protein
VILSLNWFVRFKGPQSRRWETTYKGVEAEAWLEFQRLKDNAVGVAAIIAPNGEVKEHVDYEQRIHHHSV